MTKQSAREVFEYVIEQGRRDYDVQRYKGLGEMTSTQLWETTMDPDRRTLLSVKLEDLAETESIFSTLMGEDVEARRKFIEDNALGREEPGHLEAATERWLVGCRPLRPGLDQNSPAVSRCPLGAVRLLGEYG